MFENVCCKSRFFEDMTKNCTFELRKPMSEDQQGVLLGVALIGLGCQGYTQPPRLDTLPQITPDTWVNSNIHVQIQNTNYSNHNQNNVYYIGLNNFSGFVKTF